MKLFVAVTDYDWFATHASRTGVDEVNFWRPSPGASFRVLLPGEPFLFKLHSPRNYIAGGGFFTKFLQIPVSLAWEAFGEGNGAGSIEQVRERIGKYRTRGIGSHEDPTIGCILLGEPFFFDEEDWIPAAPYLPPHTQVGKTHELDSPLGRVLWQSVVERLHALRVAEAEAPATTAAVEAARYGSPALVMPRLGQGTFRVLVTDAYNRRCAMTAEKALPVLEAAHIKPYARGGRHELSNGLLLRSDLHRLFDKGYLTVDPVDRAVVVSRRLKEEFGNGDDYYPLHGRPLQPPSSPGASPAQDYLEYHALHIFK